MRMEINGKIGLWVEVKDGLSLLEVNKYEVIIATCALITIRKIPSSVPFIG